MSKNEKYDRFLKAYADAHPLLSKPTQQKNAKKLWLEVKDDSEKYDEMLRNFKSKEKKIKAKSLENWANFWSKPAAKVSSNPVQASAPSTSQVQPVKSNENVAKIESEPAKSDEKPVEKRCLFIDIKSYIPTYIGKLHRCAKIY